VRGWRDGWGGDAGKLGGDAEKLGGDAGKDPATGTTAVAVDLTASEATASGTVAAYADGTALPFLISVSYAPGGSVADGSIAAVGKDGAIRLYNAGSRPVAVNVDLTGSYYAYP